LALHGVDLEFSVCFWLDNTYAGETVRVLAILAVFEVASMPCVPRPEYYRSTASAEKRARSCSMSEIEISVVDAGGQAPT